MGCDAAHEIRVRPSIASSYRLDFRWLPPIPPRHRHLRSTHRQRHHYLCLRGVRPRIPASLGRRVGTRDKPVSMYEVGD